VSGDQRMAHLLEEEADQIYRDEYTVLVEASFAALDAGYDMEADRLDALASEAMGRIEALNRRADAIRAGGPPPGWRF